MPTSTRGGEVEAAAPSLLNISVARLRDEAAASPVENAHQRIAADLRELAAAVQAVREGRDPALVRGALGIRVRRPGLLAALRHAILQESIAKDGVGDESARHREALELLSALERLRPPLDTGGYDGVTLRPFLDEPHAYQLLREVAHDLRSPLTSILFLAEAVRGRLSGEVNPLQHRQLGLIYSAALALQAMVSDVIDLSRGGELDDPPAPLSIRAVFGGLRDLVQPVAEEKGVDLRFSPPDADRYLGQALLLRRVLLNLTTNALKFTDHGYVEVAARPVGRTRLEFSVRDTGRGIAKDVEETLYEPFKKSGDRRGFFFSGSGLGLSIARRMLRSMGSDLDYETRAGWGTRFFFELDMPADRTG